MILVTGANSGIGKATVRALLSRGEHVIMLCRNQKRAEQARREVLPADGQGRADIVIADLASMEQIRQVASVIREQYPEVSVLINNAGIFRHRRELSPDGFEMTFAVNHLAYFLLSNELLDLLQKNGRPDKYARIINVASRAHRYGKISFTDPMAETNYNGRLVYGSSKLANILFTRELARRLQGSHVTVNCLHPGVVRTSFANQQGGLFGWAFASLRWLFIPPEKGAETVVYLATSAEVEGKSGGYYDKCLLTTPRPQARNQQDAERLWELSARLLQSTSHP